MIKLINIFKKYDEEVIIANINYKFPIYGFYFIKGKPGSGKTTLLNLIYKLDSNYEGLIIYENKTYEKNCKTIEKSKIDYIFQDDNFIENYTLKDNVFIFNLLNDNEEHFFSSEFDKNRKIKTFSYGEKQRIALKRSIDINPSVILLDEPTAYLDSNNTKIMLDMLKKYSLNHLVIATSHLNNYCDLYGKSLNINSINDEFKVLDIGKTYLEEKPNISIKNKIKISLIHIKNRFIKILSLGLCISSLVFSFMFSNQIINSFNVMINKDNNSFEEYSITKKEEIKILDYVQLTEQLDEKDYKYEVYSVVEKLYDFDIFVDSFNIGNGFVLLRNIKTDYALLNNEILLGGPKEYMCEIFNIDTCNFYNIENFIINKQFTINDKYSLYKRYLIKGYYNDINLSISTNNPISFNKKIYNEKQVSLISYVDKSKIDNFYQLIERMQNVNLSKVYEDDNSIKFLLTIINKNNFNDEDIVKLSGFSYKYCTINGFNCETDSYLSFEEISYKESLIIKPNISFESYDIESL